MTDKYILKGKEPVLESDLLTWAKWYENADRIVKQYEFPNHEVRVSTVFLGIDMAYGDEQPLALFETMIFGGAHNEWQKRYDTWDHALEGHNEAVKLAKGELTCQKPKNIQS